jgi:site-specific recombinase XerD
MQAPGTLSQPPVRSYAKTNRELAAAFERYMLARGNSPGTIRSYRDSVGRLLDMLGASSIAEVERDTLRGLLGKLYERGLTSSSIRLHTCALRAFFKFIRLTGLTKHDPTFSLPHRKVPGRLPRVLTIEEIEQLIAAASDPFERAVPEVLYSTGVRVSELVSLRLEDIDFDGRVIRVHKGKGGKDRIVLFGGKAAQAMRDYLAWRPSQAGFLFEAPARNGSIFKDCRSAKRRIWLGACYVDGKQHQISVGRVVDIPTREQARQKFDRIASKISGFRVTLARPYTTKAIGNALHRLAHRAGLGRVHPHALRRAMACHMLVAGANLREIQDLLGHAKLTTTMIYTSLTAENLRAVHAKFHPKGDDHASKE